MILVWCPVKDVHAQERAIMETLLESAEQAQLWIADRNFSTGAILAGWQCCGNAFIVREHDRNPGMYSSARCCAGTTGSLHYFSPRSIGGIIACNIAYYL